VTALQTAAFTIEVPDHDIADLRLRLSSTRWPRAWPVPAWSAGTDMSVLARLVDYWADGFDWRSHEGRLNAEPQRIATVSGQKVHFLHVRAQDPAGLPLILTNGWPSTFAEMISLAHSLVGLGHDVVVPSLPGFGFSGEPAQAPAAVSTYEIWHRLMTGLGYGRYVAHGGDLGAGITSRLGAAHPEAVAGIHLTAVMAATGLDGLTPAEEAHLARNESWTRDGGAYMHQQQTRPLTLAYGLSDSPAGLLAWILEKYRAWSDCGGDVSARWTDDDILVQASLYWFTNTIGTSFRPYFDYLAYPTAPPSMGDLPTAVAAFPYDISVPPREYAERTYNVVRYTGFDRGGHFAPHEEPELLARDIHEFATAVSAR
jgi:pimeloyl-ACP methyl ester carboxylesterase